MALRIAACLISSIHMNMFPHLGILGPPLKLHREEIIRLAQGNASNLPATSAAPKTTTTQGAAMARRVQDLAIIERDAGSCASSKTSASQTCVPSAIDAQPSPPLNAATAYPSVNTDVKEGAVQDMGVATSIQTKEAVMVDGSEGDNEDLMDIDGASNNTLLNSRKHPAPDADTGSRSPKRIRLALPGGGALEVAHQPTQLSSELARSNSPSQQQKVTQPASCSTPPDAPVAPKMPQETVMPSASMGVDKDVPKVSRVLDRQSLADHTSSESVDLPEEQRPCAATDAPLVPSIIHRHNILEPREMTVLPFAHSDKIQRSKSADALGGWLPTEYTAAPSDSESDSSYVTAAEMSDE